MRKTSQDGGDLTSATSGVENEIKKPKSGLLEFKSKKLGKRTAPNLSEESDDAVVEPLLQKNTNTAIQSAKYFAKAKADTVKEISKLFNDKKSQYASTSGFGTTETLLSEKDQAASKPNPSSNAPLHNYMNTNIFHDSYKTNSTIKSHILEEIDGSKQSGYNSSSLIFTTAKIHTDGKTKHMEPVQMTPAPILSTVEVSMSKKLNITTNEKKVSNGTSVMNTIHPQTAVNEKPKEIIVNISNSNITPVTQNKDILSKTAVANSSKTIIANSSTEKLSHTGEKPKQNTVNIINPEKTPVIQSQFMNDKTGYQSKSISPLSNISLEIHQQPKLSKAITPASVHEKPGKTKDPKMLVDEPRIVMSESKLKSTISDITKPNVSVTTTKSPLDTNVLESKSAKQSQTTKPYEGEKLKYEKINISFDRDINNKSKDKKDSQPLLIKNVKSPTTTKELISKSDLNSTKPLHEQKNTPTETGPSSFKIELKTDISSSKIPESSKDSSAKTSSSTKTSTQSKAIDNKISQEKVKSPKPSANELSKINTKVPPNDTTTSSSNNISSSAAVAKPAPSVSSSNFASSTISDTSKKSSVSNSKAITSTFTTTTLSSNAIKTQSTSTKTVTSTVNMKTTSAPSTKSSTKVSLASSIKSPQTTSLTSTSVAKQPTTSTAKTTFSKPPSLASLKTSSPSATAATAKPAISKSTSKPAGSTSSSLTSSSMAAVTATNKTKALDSIQKGGSKPSDLTKLSKA